MPSRISAVVQATDEVPGEGIDRRRTVLAPHPSAHDPILLWSEDWFHHGAFDWHPHAGFETVTYVAEGEMALADSTGASATLRPGDVQWTTAGSGFFHDGQPAKGSIVRGMQLWMNLPQHLRQSPPREQVLAGDTVPSQRSEIRCRVFAGTLLGLTGPTELLHPATFAELRFQRGRVALDLDPRQSGALYVLDGAVRVDGRRVGQGEAASIQPAEGVVDIEALQPGLALVATGVPIGGPTIMDGPFVMSTQEEIAQAYQRLEEGSMGTPPLRMHTE